MYDVSLTINASAITSITSGLTNLGTIPEVTIAIGGEIEKTSFLQSGHSTAILVPMNGGTVIQSFLWENLSNYYKSRLADLISKGTISAKAEGIPITPSKAANGQFDVAWVPQEALVLAGPGNNGVPAAADEGIWIGDRDTEVDSTGYKIDFVSGSYDYQLYEYDTVTGWAIVAGHAGATQTGDVIGVYMPTTATVTRLYLYIVAAVAASVDLSIGKLTEDYLETYTRAIAASEGAPVAMTAGIDTAGRSRLGVNVETITLVGGDAYDLVIWGLLGGTWNIVRAGTIPAQTAGLSEIFMLDHAYERMFVQLSNFVGGPVLTKTLRAIK